MMRDYARSGRGGTSLRVRRAVEDQLRCAGFGRNGTPCPGTISDGSNSRTFARERSSAAWWGVTSTADIGVRQGMPGECWCSEGRWRTSGAVGTLDTEEVTGSKPSIAHHRWTVPDLRNAGQGL